MKKKALVILADGFEEMEAVGPIDILRRAGVEVTIASNTENLQLTGRNDIHVTADLLLDTAMDDDPYDLIVLPGGPGHKRLRADERVMNLLKQHTEKQRPIGAICAAPLVLHEAGLLEGKRYTAHATAKEELNDVVEDEPVVEDGNIITSRGAGTATQFGLSLVRRLLGPEKADEVAASIHWAARNGG